MLRSILLIAFLIAATRGQPSSPPGEEAAATDDQSWLPGVIIGGVLGGLCGCGILVYYLVKKKKNSTTEPKTQPNY